MHVFNGDNVDPAVDGARCAGNSRDLCRLEWLESFDDGCAHASNAKDYNIRSVPVMRSKAATRVFFRLELIKPWEVRAVKQESMPGNAPQLSLQLRP